MFLYNGTTQDTDKIRFLLKIAAEDVNLSDVGITVTDKGDVGPRGTAWQCKGKRSVWYHNTVVRHEIRVDICTRAVYPTNNIFVTHRSRAITPWRSAEERHLLPPSTDDIGWETKWERGGVQYWRARRYTQVSCAYGGKNSPVIILNNWREALVEVAAHELCHIQQFRANSRCVEAECEHFGNAALTRYRAMCG